MSSWTRALQEITHFWSCAPTTKCLPSSLQGCLQHKFASRSTSQIHVRPCSSRTGFTYLSIFRGHTLDGGGLAGASSSFGNLHWNPAFPGPHLPWPASTAELRPAHFLFLSNAANGSLQTSSSTWRETRGLPRMISVLCDMREMHRKCYQHCRELA